MIVDLFGESILVIERILVRAGCSQARSITNGRLAR
jgi:hypothetical protein